MGPYTLAWVTFGNGRTLHGGFRNKGYLLGVLKKGNPTTWGTTLRVPYRRKPPYLDRVLVVQGTGYLYQC